MSNTQDNNTIRANNLVKQFKPWYKELKTELKIADNSGSELSTRSRRSKISRRNLWVNQLDIDIWYMKSKINVMFPVSQKDIEFEFKIY